MRIYDFIYIWAGMLDDAERHLSFLQASRTGAAWQQQGRTAEAARVAGKVRAMLVLADAEHPFRARLARLP